MCVFSYNPIQKETMPMRAWTTNQLLPVGHNTRGAFTNTCTHHFLWVGKGSYWRILSGKRTFSNKWWWTLDGKNWLAPLCSSCFLNFFSTPWTCFFSLLAAFMSRTRVQFIRFHTAGPCGHLSLKGPCPPVASTTWIIKLVMWQGVCEVWFWIWTWANFCQKALEAV